MLISNMSNAYFKYFQGLKITCRGNPGHGSRFIENTAVEKVVKYFMRLFCTKPKLIVYH